MKRILILATVAVMLLLLSPYAAAVDVAGEFSQELDTDSIEDAVPDDAADIMDGLSITDGADLDDGLGKIITNSTETIGEILKSGLKSAVVLLVIALLCALIQSVYDGKGADYVTLAGVLAVSAVAVFDIGTFMGLGRTVLDELDTFSKVLLPTLTAAAAAGGAITSAAAKYAATALFMDVLMTISRSLIMPLIYAYTATSIASAAFGGDGVAGASKLIKWVVTTLMTIMMTAFVAYLTLTGVISGATDAVATKATKTAISTVLPVVGGIISDAAETILAGASVLRNSIGIFGLLAVVAMCIVPFLRLGIQYLLYKAASGLAGTLADTRLSGLISAVGSALGMITGLVGASALMVFISVISVIKAVSG
jgi:stage III sporulation protein AE